MRDPHVVRVRYRFISEEGIVYKDCPPKIYKTKDFKGTLEDGILTCELLGHFSSEQSARVVIEPVLKSWEIGFALNSGKKEFTFVFLEVEIIDRNPSSPNSPRKKTILMHSEDIRYSIVTKYSRNSYPYLPLNNLQINQLINELWERYENYRNGKEPLPGMAQYCLTCLEGTVKKEKRIRKAIEKKYHIEFNISDKLGDLCSNKGDPQTARKYKERPIPLTEKEKKWLDACVRLIIRRLGEYEKDPSSLRMLTMEDLPPLE